MDFLDILGGMFLSLLGFPSIIIDARYFKGPEKHRSLRVHYRILGAHRSSMIRLICETGVPNRCCRCASSAIVRQSSQVIP